ncbi:hypothetical protein DLE54_04420 [Psychrobacter sp. YP14]|uniref:Uncharacterized protein n=3 Tax=Psychrobacter TaxID=497 RepID=A0A844LZ12_9GAMM|nr:MULTISPECIES: hypothetical protein [Psychrobacter]AWT48850.1 hypothetical protein DLE54_04420 [Psychrobacter sp. YP14]MUG31931.1 hypothetical protein [Psychrobacter sanguinis]UNK06165.1 hypothetical protein MN210_05985 [Psychrobacter sp. PraFG1]
MSSKRQHSQLHSDVPQKPELLKNSKIKIFVLLLCVVSFYAGWQASRSHLVKECQMAGAQTSVEQGLVYCKMP